MNEIPIPNILPEGRNIYLKSAWKATSMSYHKEL